MYNDIECPAKSNAGSFDENLIRSLSVLEGHWTLLGPGDEEHGTGHSPTNPK